MDPRLSLSLAVASGVLALFADLAQSRGLHLGVAAARVLQLGSAAGLAVAAVRGRPGATRALLFLALFAGAVASSLEAPGFAASHVLGGLLAAAPGLRDEKPARGAFLSTSVWAAGFLVGIGARLGLGLAVQGAAAAAAFGLSVAVAGFASFLPSSPAWSDTFGEATLGRYAIIRRLGRGGMANVYAAVHRELGISVAIKRPSTLHPAAVACIENEARIVGRFVHPGIVRAHELTRDSAKLPCLVMEYLPGSTLHRAVRTGGAFEPYRAARIVSSMARALDEVHKAGIVHRDIKPENTVLLDEDRIKIIDFGLACTVTEGRANARAPLGKRLAVGTPGFMAPEIATGSEPTPSSDVYSLGCVLYFLLTGAAPFSAKTHQETMASHALLTVVPPRSWRRSIPREVEEVVLRCLEKDPKFRFVDAGALARALADVAPCSDDEATRPHTARGPLADAQARLRALPELL